MIVDVHIESAWTDANTPSEQDFSAWVAAALAGHRANGEVAIRIVDEAEGAQFNQRYRKRTGPTNVLSFPSELPPGMDLPLIGDLLICGPVVVREAREQDKAPQAHWAHLTVHGVLHLLGYDHQHDDEATEMETLETRILATLGFPAPYAAPPR